MKIISIILQLILLVTASAEGSFFDGNENFNDGKYSEAVESYNQAIDSEGYSFAKLFNLGMSHKHNGSNGLALLNFERARLLNSSKKVLNQIDDLRNKLGSSAPQDLTKQSQTNIIKLWVGAACISFWMIIFFILSTILTRKFSKINIVAGALFTAILALALIEANKMITNDLCMAIVINNEAELLASPVSKSPKIGQMNEGEYVKMSVKNNNFVHVKSKNGLRGWIKAVDIEEIIPSA
jgi:hypothetical protein